jgi:hypothetical protein
MDFMLVENTLSLVRVIVASEFVVVTLIALAGTLLVHFCLFYGVFWRKKIEYSSYIKPQFFRSDHRRGKKK